MTDPPIAGLDHLVLHVADGAVAAAFYRDVLGARVEELPYGRLRFRIGDAVLNVHQPTSTPHPRAAHPGGPGSGDLCFAYAGTAEEALAHLAARGVAADRGAGRARRRPRRRPLGLLPRPGRHAARADQLRVADARAPSRRYI